MSSQDAEKPNHPESGRPSERSPYPLYTAILFTALIALLFGILIAHGVLASKIADGPKVVAEAVKSLGSDLSYLRSINSELDLLNSKMRTMIPSTVTVAPGLFATFTMAAGR
ncbi:hypothetical protein M413DRAFT_440364 [Hebeloma cylindrosporum]|uniref:Uncharacterized protein n=1 Tax=Hebeloma cylindrosporum TaxID=76867 RepID=A0A0C3CRT8_HEBCY|nr:hypothetical protein M413DRAFT_440364 [Hebeloma cylindrosporum h7]